MKNSFRFIFPRLIAATVIVGLASLILATIFKLLIGVLIIGGIVAAASRLARRGNHALRAGRYAQFSNGGIGPVMNGNHWDNSVTVNANPLHKQTIVPIN